MHRSDDMAAIELLSDVIEAIEHTFLELIMTSLFLENLNATLMSRIREMTGVVLRNGNSRDRKRTNFGAFRCLQNFHKSIIGSMKWMYIIKLT